MKIYPVDSTLTEQVLLTNWLNTPWRQQEGQENWPRRRINNTALLTPVPENSFRLTSYTWIIPK